MDWLLLQGDAEALLDCGDDVVAEVDDIGGGGVAAVDKGKGVARGDAGLAVWLQGEALGEASVFEQPGCGQLDAFVSGWPAGDGGGIDAEGGSDVIEGGGGDDGIFEERSGAAAVLLAGNEHHAFAVADLADGVVDVDGCRRVARGDLCGEVAGEVGVGEVGGSSRAEAEDDLGDDVAVALGGVEDAVAIAEAAGRARQCDEGEGFKIEGAHGVDGLGDLLAVGADVLDGGAADGAGDAGEALDAADALLADVVDEVVPVHASGDVEVDVVGAGDGGQARGFQGADGDAEYESVEAGVADQEIAATAEGEDRELLLACELDGFEELIFRRDGAEKTSGPADPEGGVGGKRDVLLDGNGSKRHG